MKVYNIDETCSILKLKTPVLRKYSALLEDAGYTGIGRNSSNARFYTEENIAIMRELISYKDSGHMTLNDAAKSIAERINGIDVIEDITKQQIVNVAQQQDIERLQDAILTLTDHIQKSEERHAKNIAIIMSELQDLKTANAEMKQIEVVADLATPEDERMADILKELQYTRKELRELKEAQQQNKVESVDKPEGFLSRFFRKRKE